MTSDKPAYIRISERAAQTLKRYGEFSSTKTMSKNVELILEIVDMMLPYFNRNGEKYIDKERIQWIMDSMLENIEALPEKPTPDPYVLLASDKKLSKEYLQRVWINKEHEANVFTELYKRLAFPETEPTAPNNPDTSGT